MNNNADMFNGADIRQDARIPFDLPNGLIVEIHHPGGSVINYLVRPRNISSNGIGFVHGGFLYNGSTCILALKTMSGQVKQITGKVVRCNHIEATAHEVGVEFDNPVDTGMFIQNFTKNNSLKQQNCDMPCLKGQILYIEESVNDQELLKFVLSNIGVEVQFAANSSEAVKLIGDNSFAAIMISQDTSDMTTAEIVDELKSKNNDIPIIAVTADDSPETNEQLKYDGCDHVLEKPFDMDELTKILGRYLQRDITKSNKSPLISACWANTQMRPLILSFLDRLESQIDKFEQYMTANDMDKLSQEVMEVKGAAGSYGYPQITQSAQLLLELVQSGSSDSDKIRTGLNELIDMCAAACRSRRSSKDD